MFKIKAMQVVLNTEQAKGLSIFFFDIAKGLILGGIGSAVVSSQARIPLLLLVTLFSFGCIKIALALLEEVDL